MKKQDNKDLKIKQLEARVSELESLQFDKWESSLVEGGIFMPMRWVFTNGITKLYMKMDDSNPPTAEICEALNAAKVESWVD